MNNKEKDFLTIHEFAEIISVHYNTVYNMIKKGRISAFRLSKGKGSSYRIARSEIQRMAILDLEDLVDDMVENKIKERK